MADEDGEKTPRKAYWRQLLLVLLPDQLVVAVAVYTLTGVVSPTMIDYVSHTYQPDQWALFPVLSTAIGMALVGPLNRYLVEYHSSSPSLQLEGGTKSLVRMVKDFRIASPIAGLDLTATTLVTIGLVNVGSATFTVIYSSAAAWTAVMSWYRGHPLSKAQVLGVFLVTSGLFINGLGHLYEDEARTEAGLLLFMLSCLALLLGTVLHSVVMVRIDEFTRESKQHALQVASAMGRLQVFALLMWNSLRIMWFGVRSSTGSGTSTSEGGGGGLMPLAALVWFLLLSINQSLHSLAFFNMIGRLGAVGSAVLKGFLALNTFGLAAALFCREGHSEQCLTPLKTTSMMFVFVGGVIYGVSTKKQTSSSSGIVVRKEDAVLPI